MAYKVTVNSVWQLALAVIILFVVIPFLPTTLLIQPKSITVIGDKVHLVRTVTFPWGVQGHWQHEWERLSPPPPVASLSCSISGSAFYEDRGGTPLVYAHGCQIEGPPESTWLFRACWQAELIAGIKLQPTCLTTTFMPAAAAAIREQGVLKEELQQLRSTVEGIN